VEAEEQPVPLRQSRNTADPDEIAVELEVVPGTRAGEERVGGGAEIRPSVPVQVIKVESRGHTRMGEFQQIPAHPVVTAAQLHAVQHGVGR